MKTYILKWTIKKLDKTKKQYVSFIPLCQNRSTHNNENITVERTDKLQESVKSLLHSPKLQFHGWHRDLTHLTFSLTLSSLLPTPSFAQGSGTHQIPHGEFSSPRSRKVSHFFSEVIFCSFNKLVSSGMKQMQ